MNKKITALVVALSAVTCANAQEYNLFDPADVDANGWIWFDTQEKIDKYIGQADNENGMIDPNGKIIQLICADFGDYEDSTVNPTQIGVGTDKEEGGVGAKKGAIITASASALGQTNGGGFVVRMPSCVSFNLFVSGAVSTYVRLFGSTDQETPFKDYAVVSAQFASFFKALLQGGGQIEWTDLETLDNNMEPYFRLKSSTPIYARFESLTKGPVYIHGMKVITSTPSTGLSNPTADSQIRFEDGTLFLGEVSDVQVYSTTGLLVASSVTDQMNLSPLAAGVYVVKARSASGERTAKISIR